MAVLTWKNLPLPGVSTSMRDVDQFINRAFEQALGGVDQIQQYNQENADRAILQRALAIQDPEEYARALAEGQITGPDRANASMDMLRFVDSRRSDLKKEQQQDFQYGRERRLAERDDYLYDRRRGSEQQAVELFRRAIRGDREGAAEGFENIPYEDLIQFGHSLQQLLGGAEKKQDSDRTFELQKEQLRHKKAEAAAARRAASQQQAQAQRKELVGRFAAQIYFQFPTLADYKFGSALIRDNVPQEYQTEVLKAYVALLKNSPTAQQGQSTGVGSSQGGTSFEQNFSSDAPFVSPLVRQTDSELADQLDQFIEAVQDRRRTIDSENPYREDISDNISQGDAIDVLQKRLGKGANVGKIQEKFIEFKKKYPHLTNGEITNFMLNSIAPTSWSKGLGNKTTFSEKRFEAQAVRVGDIREQRREASRLNRDLKDIAVIQDRLGKINEEIQRISGLSPTEATARRLNELQHEASQLFNRLRQYGPRAIVEQSEGDEAQETGTTSPSEPVAAETEIEKDNRKRYRVSSVGKINGEERFQLREIRTPESNSGYEYKWSSTSPSRQEIIDNRILLSEHKEVTDRYEELFNEKTRRYGRGRRGSISLYGVFPEIEEEIVQELRAEGFNINAPIDPYIERKRISEAEKVIRHFEDKVRTSTPRRSEPNLDLASKYQQKADGTDNPVIKYNELVNKHIALAGANPEKLDRKSQLYQRARLAAAEEMDELGIRREVYGGPKNLNASTPQNSLPVASNPKHDPEPVITSKSINVNTGEETTPINIPKSAFKDAPTEQAVQARPGAIPEGLGTKVLVTFVKDGDSFNYQDPIDPNVTLECRLDTIDAPETAKRDSEGNVFQEGQPYGEEAAAFLEELILNREVNILVTRTDHRGRNICQVEVEGVEVDQQLLENGLAYLYERFVSPLNPRWERLQSAQKRAQERGVGIFSLPPEQRESPYNFRQRTIGQR